VIFIIEVLLGPKPLFATKQIAATINGQTLECLARWTVSVPRGLVSMRWLPLSHITRRQMRVRKRQLRIGRQLAQAEASSVECRA